MCLSGSTIPSVGQWLSPSGTDLSSVVDDAFEVTVGDSYSPGSIVIMSPVGNPPLATTDEGVYTCVIPDETGRDNYLYVGIYLSGFSG